MMVALIATVRDDRTLSTTKANMETTRRYPRTLNEAFPTDASYACAIERCDDRIGSMAATVLRAASVGSAVFFVLAWAVS